MDRALQWEHIQAYVSKIRPKRSKKGRMRQYYAVLWEISPPPELQDKTARFIADKLRL